MPSAGVIELEFFLTVATRAHRLNESLVHQTMCQGMCIAMEEQHHSLTNDKCTQNNLMKATA